MAIIQCDIRRGRSDDQKRQLASGLTRVVSEVSGERADQMFLVIREMPGFNFVDSGEHVADYVPGPDGIDLAGSQQLRDRAIPHRLKAPKNVQGEDMPFIQVDIAQELTLDQLTRMREEIVDVVHEAIGSARAHINVAIRQLPPENLVEAGKTESARQPAEV